MTSLAEVRLWGATVGAVSLGDDARAASFEYAPGFVARGIELAPLTMPLAGRRPYAFPALSEETFHALPGLLADSLPDRFGNALIDAWLATRGEGPGDFDAVRRLSYIGRRGMGALEFAPAIGPEPSISHRLDVEALADLAAEVLADRADLAGSLSRSGKRSAMREILRVGTSAGGARAKALIALDPSTNEVRSGQLDVPPGFEHWILKFDGVEDRARDLGASRGYGAIEWVYSGMAQRAGIEMTECRLLEEGGRRHFMTRRFDRGPGGDKIHMQSLGAIAHLDFNQAGANSYEQAFQVIRRLGLPQAAAEQLFRRMVFNVVARNQDDHVKNIAFLMDRNGTWTLSPAFDVVYAYNPRGRQTARHQMSINGKRDGFSVADLRAVAAMASMKRGQADEILAGVREAVAAWPRLAAAAAVDERRIERIREAQRIDLPLG
ncbi:MAG: type II toxin-antitoxin system HipA family toxin [Solirubrobacterales bacterium]